MLLGGVDGSSTQLCMHTACMMLLLLLWDSWRIQSAGHRLIDRTPHHHSLIQQRCVVARIVHPRSCEQHSNSRANKSAAGMMLSIATRGDSNKDHSAVFPKIYRPNTTLASREHVACVTIVERIQCSGDRIIGYRYDATLRLSYIRMILRYTDGCE